MNSIKTDYAALLDKAKLDWLVQIERERQRELDREAFKRMQQERG